MSPRQDGKGEKVAEGIEQLFLKYNAAEKNDPATLEAFKAEMRSLVAQALPRPLSILPATSLTCREVSTMFSLNDNLKEDGFWQEIQEEPLPKDLLENLKRIQPVMGFVSLGPGIYSRMVIDQLLLSSVWEEKFGEKSQPDSAKIDQKSPLLLRQDNAEIEVEVSYEGEPRMLSGVADITLWYDEPDNLKLVTNFIIMRAEEPGAVDACVPELMAYMGAVHTLRKADGKSDAAVYGLASDGDLYRFCRIDAASHWSQNVLLDRNAGHERKIYSTLSTIVRLNALSSPSTSTIKQDLEQREEEVEASGSSSHT